MRRLLLCLLLLAPLARGKEFLDLPYTGNATAKQHLDLFTPDDLSTPHPMVVWIHGGGWLEGSKKGCPAKPIVAQGYVVASLEYRFSSDAPYPAQIEDCKSALRFLRAHAKEYGIDPERIGVWGASAGGHLVALLGTTGDIRDFDKGDYLDQSSRVSCVIDWFGPTDFLHYGAVPPETFDRPDNAVARLLGGPFSQKQELARQASPIYFVNKDSAPFLIMHGDADPLVPLQQSQELDAALHKAGVESTLKVFPGAGHGGPAFNSPEALQTMVEFVTRHLAPKTAGNQRP